MQTSLLHRDLTEKIIGIFYEVYNELGFGFAELVYHRALVTALIELGLRIDSKAAVPVFFRGKRIATFEPDIVVEDSVILELKATQKLDPSSEAQILNYLRATEIEVGLLLNFGERPNFKRMVFENSRKQTVNRKRDLFGS